MNLNKKKVGENICKTKNKWKEKREQNEGKQLKNKERSKETRREKRW